MDHQSRQTAVNGRGPEDGFDAIQPGEPRSVHFPSNHECIDDGVLELEIFEVVFQSVEFGQLEEIVVLIHAILYLEDRTLVQAVQVEVEYVLFYRQKIHVRLARLPAEFTVEET